MEIPLTGDFDIVEVSRFTTVGYIQPGWMLIKPLSGVVEQDQAGHYFFISNEGLGLYAVGFTQEEALADFKTSLIGNYQLLEARVRVEPDLELLFQEYQAYLHLEDGERLKKGSHKAGDISPTGPEKGPGRSSRRFGLRHSHSRRTPEQPSPERAAAALIIQPGRIEVEAAEDLDPLNLDELALLLSLLAEYRAKALPQRADLEELGRLERKLKHLAAEAAGRDRPG
jgi:hypothetical protein